MRASSSNRKIWMLVGILLVVLVGGLAELVHFRFEKGDAYPEYSSYRKDGLGSGVLFESLKLLPQLNVERQIKTSLRIPQPQETLLFWLGSDRDFEFKEKTSRFVEQGGHLVLSVGLSRSLSQAMQSERSRERDARRSRTILGVTYARLAVPEREMYRMEPVQDDGPRFSLAGFGQGGFVDLSSDWETLYETAGVATVVRRTFGKGTVTLFANSYPFSNECLLRDPPLDFYQWLLSGKRHVFFDETHLGVVSSPGMVGLLKRYHLTPLYLSLIVLGLLSVWRASASLLPKTDNLPPPQLKQSSGATAQSDKHHSGVVGLIRRHVPRNELFRLCVERWLASTPHLSRRDQQYRQEIEILGKRPVKNDAQLVELYRQAAEKLAAKQS